jgi:hypothetical protein
LKRVLGKIAGLFLPAVGIGLLLLPVLLYVFRKRIDPVRYA